MSHFQFVAINGAVDEGPRGGRRIVRSHVMKRYHHERKVRSAIEVHRYLHRKASGIHFNQQDDQHGDELSSEFRIGYQIVPSHPYIHSCINQHVASVEEGYALLSPSVQEPSPLSMYWLSAAMTSPMLFYASLFVSSASAEVLSHRPVSTESFRTRGRALRLVNMALGDDDPERRMCDEVIASILSLANFECVIGDMGALRCHLQGLQRIHNLRGGLEISGMSGLLFKLTWLYSWFLALHPGPHQGIPAISTEEKADPVSFSEFLTLTSNHPLRLPEKHRPVVMVFYSTFQTLEGQHYPTDRPDFEDVVFFTDETVRPSAVPTVENIIACCQIALSLYTDRLDNLYDKEKTDSGSLEQLMTLKDLLESTRLPSDWLPSFPGPLLWCIVVGVICAEGQGSLYAWYASRLLQFWVSVALSRWDGLRRCLLWLGQEMRSVKEPLRESTLALNWTR